MPASETGSPESEPSPVRLQRTRRGKSGASLELEVSAEGQILLTEERVPLDAVPLAVLSALTSKHSEAKPLRADKQTTPDGKVTYEIGFLMGNRKRDATIASDGTFLDEE